MKINKHKGFYCHSAQLYSVHLGGGSADVPVCVLKDGCVPNHLLICIKLTLFAPLARPDDFLV